MGFHFGDLTPAPFTTNFLEELRDAVDFAAALADADQCIVTADARRDALRRRADEDKGRIDSVVHAVRAALAAAEKGEKGSGADALAADLSQLVAVRRDAAEAAVEKKLSEAIRALEKEMLEARADYFPMLERYLLARVPLSGGETRRVELVGVKKDERRYVSEITGRSDLGLEWTIEVALPSEGKLSTALRVEDVVEDLSITAPHLTGLIKKEVKPKKAKLDRFFVTRVVDDEATIRIEVRDEIGKPDGYDITADLARRVIMVAKTGEEDDVTAGTFDVAAEDFDALVAFAAKMRAMVRELPKKKLATATFDGQPFDGENTEAQPKLVQLVARLADKLGPLVDELALRSRSDEELVLRRVLEGDKREELFMPKSRLRDQLEGLDDAHRDMFASIESALGASNVAEPQTIDVEEPAAAKAASAPAPPPVRSEVPVAVAPYVRRDSNKQMMAVKIEIPKSPPPPPVLELQPDSLPVLEVQPEEEEEPPPSSTSADLKTSLKKARALLKDGKIDESFREWAALFASPGFVAARPEDQRAALKMMVHAKTPPSVTASEAAKAAHRATLPALQKLVVVARDPADYEMLGMAYVVLDEPEKALEIFKKALEIERAKSPGSDLCGDLMRRVSQL